MTGFKLLSLLSHKYLWFIIKKKFVNYRTLEKIIIVLDIINQFRSSHQRCSMQKGVLRNFIKFTGKHLCQSLFFNKVVASGLQHYQKKRLCHRCFPVNFVKFLRTSFSQNTSGRLLLSILLLFLMMIANCIFMNFGIYSRPPC